MARTIGRGENASKFCVMREKRGGWAIGRCDTWFGAHLEVDTGAHSRLDGLKTERVHRQSLLAAMALLTKSDGQSSRRSCRTYDTSELSKRAHHPLVAL